MSKDKGMYSKTKLKEIGHILITYKKMYKIDPELAPSPDKIMDKLMNIIDLKSRRV